MNNTALIIILAICVLLSAFFSGAEIAYAKVNQLKLKRANPKKEKSAKLALGIAENYTSTLTTILVGNNLVNIAASSTATLLFTNLFVNTVFESNTELWTTIIMTLIVLTFGEILPKSICTSYNYGTSKLFAWPIKIFSIVFFPITYPVNKLINRIKEEIYEEPEVTSDELIEMVDTLNEQELINEDTQELITNAIDFIDTYAVEIMLHRTDVLSFNIEDDINDLINNPNLLNHSRIPVYEDSFDNILGILNTKQLIKLYLNKDNTNIRDLLTDPLYVFETQAISDVLRKLKQNHIHMAVVKDEYGGNMGILTMEDILEELVGEIYDEMDEDELEEYHKVNDKKFTVNGDMNIYDFFDLIEHDYDDYDNIYTTVGGWITGMINKFPEVDDSFTFENYLITVIRASEFTVERASIVRLTDEEEKEDEE